MTSDTVRFLVEEKDTQVPRQAKVGGDGALNVWITQQQYGVFMFVARLVLEKHDSPSFQEIADACGYANRVSARDAVHKLADRGLLAVNIRRVRGIGVSPKGEEVYAKWKKKDAVTITLKRIKNRKLEKRRPRWKRRMEAEARRRGVR